MVYNLPSEPMKNSGNNIGPFPQCQGPGGWNNEALYSMALSVCHSCFPSIQDLLDTAFTKEYPILYSPGVSALHKPQ